MINSEKRREAASTIHFSFLRKKEHSHHSVTCVTNFYLIALFALIFNHMPMGDIGSVIFSFANAIQSKFDIIKHITRQLYLLYKMTGHFQKHQQHTTHRTFTNVEQNKQKSSSCFSQMIFVAISFYAPYSSLYARANTIRGCS